ncbi:MAG: hypothetical protein IPL61_14420 [Myxococcales bacterium]|nr:hypothetical protein [Myxococcales bacterium]
MTARSLVALSKLALVALLALTVAGCLRDHDPGLIQTGGNDCYTCHHSDYTATTTPPHTTDTARYHRACSDCHKTSAWQPALEGPHAGRFRRGGDHSGVACLECHDPDRGPSAGGANTICALCHEHEDAHHRDPNNPSSCLPCHQTGGG